MGTEESQRTGSERRDVEENNEDVEIELCVRQRNGNGKEMNS